MNQVSDPALAPDANGVGMVDWQGRSGRHYLLVGEYLDTFVMREADLYLIAKGSDVLWVGSTGDLVADPASRIRFRRALNGANRAFRLDAPADRQAAAWDLEGATPVPFSIVQAA